jgi:2-methylcitrate dehydratase PrpD
VGAFTADALGDPLVADLAARVRAEAEPGFDRDYPESRRAELDVRLRDGERLTIRQEHASGDPELPLAARRLEEKFLGNAVFALGEAGADELRDAILALPGTDCAPVLDALSRRATVSR